MDKISDIEQALAREAINQALFNMSMEERDALCNRAIEIQTNNPESIKNMDQFKQNLQRVCWKTAAYRSNLISDFLLRTPITNDPIKAPDAYKKEVAEIKTVGENLLTMCEQFTETDIFKIIDQTYQGGFRTSLNNLRGNIDLLNDKLSNDVNNDISLLDRIRNVINLPSQENSNTQEPIIYPADPAEFRASIDANGENISDNRPKTVVPVGNEENNKKEEETMNNTDNNIDLDISEEPVADEAKSTITGDFDVADLLGGDTYDPSKTNEELDLDEILGTTPKPKTPIQEDTAKKGILWKIFKKRKHLLALAEKQLKEAKKELTALQNKNKTDLTQKDKEREKLLETQISELEAQIKKLKGKGIRNGIIGSLVGAVALLVLIVAIITSGATNDNSQTTDNTPETTVTDSVDESKKPTKPTVSTQSVQTLTTLNNAIIGNLSKISNYKILSIESTKVNPDNTVSIIANASANNGTALTREFKIKTSAELAYTLNSEATNIVEKEDDEKNEKNYLATLNDILANAKAEDVTETSYAQPKTISTDNIKSSEILGYAYAYHHDEPKIQGAIDNLQKGADSEVQIEIISQKKQAFVKTKINSTTVAIEFALPSNISRNQAITYVEKLIADKNFAEAVNVTLETNKHEMAMSEIESSLESSLEATN